MRPGNEHESRIASDDGGHSSPYPNGYPNGSNCECAGVERFYAQLIGVGRDRGTLGIFATSLLPGNGEVSGSVGPEHSRSEHGKSMFRVVLVRS